MSKKLRDALVPDEIPDGFVVLGVFLVGRRDDMVEDDDDFLGRLDLVHAEFLELADDGRRIVVGQVVIRGDGDDFAGPNRPPGFPAEDFFENVGHSLMHLYLEDIEIDEVGVVDDDRLDRPPAAVAFLGVGGDNVDDLLGQAVFVGEGRARNRMAEEFALPALHENAVLRACTRRACRHHAGWPRTAGCRDVDRDLAGVGSRSGPRRSRAAVLVTARVCSMRLTWSTFLISRVKGIFARSSAVQPPLLTASNQTVRVRSRSSGLAIRSISGSKLQDFARSWQLPFGRSVVVEILGVDLPHRLHPGLLLVDVGHEPGNAGDDEKSVADFGRDAQIAEQSGDGPVDVDGERLARAGRPGPSRSARAIRTYRPARPSSAARPNSLAVRGSLVCRRWPNPEARLPFGLHLVQGPWRRRFVAALGVGPLGDVQEQALAFLDRPAVEAVDGQHPGRDGGVEVGPGRGDRPGGQDRRRAGPVVDRRDEDRVQKRPTSASAARP